MHIPDNSRQIKFAFLRYDHFSKKRQKYNIPHILQLNHHVLAKQCEQQKSGSIPVRATNHG